MDTNRNGILQQQFNNTIDAWIGWLDNYSLEMLLRQPGPGQWSLGQVYTHLIADTGYFIDQIRMALSDTSHVAEDMHKAAAAIFANNEFPDRRLSNPFPDEVVQPVSKEALLAGLLFIKHEINSFFLSHYFSDHTGKAAHPGLLFFTASEWLQFAEMHMRHHFRQKARIDAHLSEQSS